MVITERIPAQPEDQTRRGSWRLAAPLVLVTVFAIVEFGRRRGER